MEGLLIASVGVLVLLVALWRVVIDIRGIDDVRRTDRKEKGQCLACGYDLTGNVSGTCPECGTACTIEDQSAQ